MAIVQVKFTQIATASLASNPVVFALSESGDVWYNQGGFASTGGNGVPDTSWHRYPTAWIDDSVNEGAYIPVSNNGVIVPNTSDLSYTSKPTS